MQAVQDRPDFIAHRADDFLYLRRMRVADRVRQHDLVDTGIGERSKHARESYLRADEFPRITVTVEHVVAVRQDAPAAIAFRATGTLGLIGKTHAIDITGTLIRPDAAGLARMKLTGDVLIARAAFEIPVRETALASDAGDFDAPVIPIVVSLVLRHTGG